MRKTTMKLLSILLTFVMLTGAACLSAFAESKNNYKKVTLIGDSIATALRMEYDGEGAPPESIAKMYRFDANTGKWIRTGATHGAWVENSWPARVVRGVGLNEKDFYNYGREAFSSIEFRRLLDASYSPSADDLVISEGLYSAYGDDAQGRGLAEQRKTVKKDLAKSDLVLVGMGSNDIFSYALVHYNSAMSGAESTPLTAAQKKALYALNDIIAPLVENGQFAEAWAKIFQTAATVNALQQVAVIMVKEIIAGVQKFIENWDQIINKIHEYNPDADVYAVSLFNATAGLYLTEELTLIDFGQIMAPVFDTMNAHMKQYAKQTGYYTYVDCTKTDHPAWPSILNIVQDTSQLMVYMMLCTHPTYAGQKYMAEQVLAAIPDKPSNTRWVRKSVFDGKWYCYKGDDIEWSYTGIAKNEYGWWRIVEGEVDFNANSIYKNEYGWWKCTDGKVTFKENGVFKNEYGWWRVENSKVNFDFKGIASNKYGTWYIEGGKVNFKKNGKITVDPKTKKLAKKGTVYTVKNGKIVK